LLYLLYINVKMMKKITIVALFMGVATAFGQVTAPSFNRLSIDAQIGVNNATRTYTPGYGDGFSLASFEVGARFMPNATFGLMGTIGFDGFNASKVSLPFKSKIIRGNVQVAVNLANAFNFYEWTEKFSLLAHTGIGFGVFNSDASSADVTAHMMAGVTPQYKLSNKLSLNVDLSIVGNASQARTFDGNSGNGVGGLSQAFFTGRVGVSYYLGRFDQHSDWSPTRGVTMDDMQMMRAEMEKMKKGMKDDDGDGVPNYLDKEPATPAGNVVDMQGVTDPNRMDTDKDGIADSFDDCPEEEGKFAANGCPDMDGDGVADKDDKCPNVAGVASNNGCPVSTNQKVVMDAEVGTVYFEVGKSAMSMKEAAKVSKIIDMMNSNPTYSVILKGHADKIGSFDLNQQLSDDRAAAVKKYMIQKGIDPLRITAVAYGSSFPLSTDNTSKSRANNRRVEFEVRN
jgi:OOP family OmpA-OmpF porin